MDALSGRGVDEVGAAGKGTTVLEARAEGVCCSAFSPAELDRTCLAGPACVGLAPASGAAGEERACTCPGRLPLGPLLAPAAAATTRGDEPTAVRADPLT